MGQTERKGRSVIAQVKLRPRTRSGLVDGPQSPDVGERPGAEIDRGARPSIQPLGPDVENCATL